MQQAQGLYLAGGYEAAEKVVKQALSIDPFAAQAHFLLGKILLLRGTATHDYRLLRNARLMFEMAVALEPEFSEARDLVELLRAY